jgi:hypothetical protein
VRQGGGYMAGRAGSCKAATWWGGPAVAGWQHGGSIATRGRDQHRADGRWRGGRMAGLLQHRAGVLGRGIG